MQNEVWLATEPVDKTPRCFLSLGSANRWLSVQRKTASEFGDQLTEAREWSDGSFGFYAGALFYGYRKVSVEP
jgi:hypothetical protein